MKKRIIQVFTAAGITLIAILSLFLIDRIVIGEREAEEKIIAFEEYFYGEPKNTTMKYDWYYGGGYIGGNYHYDSDKDIIFDEEYNALWKKYFEGKIEEAEAFMDTNVLLEDYSLLTYVDGTDVMTCYDDLFIYGFYNTQQTAEEKRVEEGAEAIWEIISRLNDDYNLCGVHIDYYDPDGVYRFSIDMNKEKITKEMLINCATEVSFEENPAIREKWEAFSNQRGKFWSMETEDYEISLMGMEESGDYQLVMIKEDKETVLATYPRYENGNPYEYEHGTFENLLGYLGFYVYEDSNNPFDYGHYYTMSEEEAVCILEATGNHGVNCFIVDVDKDGITEFIHNVTFGADGARSTKIYYNDGTQILEGWCDDLLDVEYDNVHYLAEYSYYVPEEEVVEIGYYLKAIDGYETKKYEIDLEKITFYPVGEANGQTE